MSGLWSVARSLLLYGAGPLIVLQVAQHFVRSHGSVIPILCASCVPAVGLIATIVVRHTINVIALIAFFETGAEVIVALATSSRSALAVSVACRYALLGAIFGISLVVDKPLIASLARQGVAGDDASKRRDFDERSKQPRVHARFRFITLVWCASLVVLGIVFIGAGQVFVSGAFVIISKVAGDAVLALLGVWSFVYMRHVERTQTVAADGA